MKNCIGRLACAGLLTVLMYSVAHGQTQQGQSIASGMVNLSGSGTSEAADVAGSGVASSRSTGYGVGLALNRGVFVRTNWLLGYGARLGITQRTDENSLGGRPATYSASYTNLNWSATLYVRRYWPVVDRLWMYAGGGLLAQQFRSVGKVTANPGTSAVNDQRLVYVNWAVQPTGQVGALYALTNRIALEANVSTNGFPVGVGGASVGIALLAGRGRTTGVADDFVAPQTRRGRWLLGAAAGVSGGKQTKEGTTTNNTTYSSAGAQVSAGRFVRDNLLLGLAVDYSAQRSGDISAPGPVGYSVAISPFVRSYIGPHRLRPFVGGGVQYGVGKWVTAATQRQMGVQLNAGLAYMVGERFIVQTTLGTLAGQYRRVPDLPDGRTQSGYDVSVDATMLSAFSVAYSL